MTEFHDIYHRLRKILDIIFDWIVIFSIWIVAIVWVVSIIFAWLDIIWLNYQLPVEVNYALKTALNTIIILKTYETLKLFISTNHASVENILELWLIWLSVKIFFDNKYLTLVSGWIFVMLFACYMVSKYFKRLEKLSPHHSHTEDKSP